MRRKRVHIPSIFQGKLEFPSVERRSFSLSIEHPAESVVFRALLGILFALTFAYIYFVGSSVLNIIARKEALSQAAQIGVAISGSEKEYFAMSQKITPDAGVSLGLAPVLNTAYVYRPGAVGEAQTLHNEI